MLINVTMLVGLVAFIATVALNTQLMFGRQEIAAQADTYATQSLVKAQGDLVSYVDAQVQSSGNPGGPFTAPTPGPMAPVSCASGTANCQFNVQTSIQMEGQSGGSPASTNETELNQNAAASEGRVSAVITATIYAADQKTILATRKELVSLDTYLSDSGDDARLVGTYDISANTNGAISEGDIGGCDGSSSCGDSQATQSVGDTRLHVYEKCVPVGSLGSPGYAPCQDTNPSGSAEYKESDNYNSTSQWSDQNASNSGWTH